MPIQHQYVVVNSKREPVSPPVFTPSRAQFFLRTFRALNPERTYEIKVLSL